MQRKVVSDAVVNEKKRELNDTAADIIESADMFKTRLDEFAEVIETLKICANTYGGLKRVNELASMEFDTKYLEGIKNSLDYVDIKENISKYEVDEDNL